MKGASYLLDRFRTSVRRSGILRPTTFKVVVFAVACLIVLGALVARIGNISFFSNRTTYHAALADATGLHPSDAVKIAGVTVGEVDAVALRRGHALVTFSVNHGVKIPSDTEVGEQWHNVLGQMYLYLYPGHATAHLKAGATIPLSRNVSGANVGALLNTLGPLLGALHPHQANQVIEAFAQALQGNETQVDNLITNAAQVSHTIGSVDVQVGQVIGDLNQVLGALAGRSGDLGQVITNLQAVTSSLAGRNDLLDQTVANLGRVAAELATLEGNTHTSLSSAIADLKAVSSEIES
ncbi:MAG TPA: MCE family protein, partial [Mycobacterium sp.]|nr:MCE family protein [Mycobacterium sp.]